MSIKKMLLLASMALTAVAFAAPVAAQADVTLKEGGQKLAIGSEITATSTNLRTTFGGVAELTCEKVTLHYEVAVNGPTHVVLNPVPPVHNATAVNCGLTTTPSLVEHGSVITESGTEQLTINTWGTGVTKATFTSNGVCKLSGNVHVQGAASGSDIINVSPSVLTGGPAPCPTAGLIHGSATLETKGGQEVTLDFIKTG